MKKFLTRIILFFLLVIGVLGTVVGYLSYRLNSESIYIGNAGVEYLIVGDSHTQYSVNDSILSNTLNISNNADSYLYSYVKIKKMLGQNPQLKGVLLGYSEPNMEEGMEDWNFRDINLRNKVSQYYSMLAGEEIYFLAERNPFSFLNGVVQFPKMKWRVVKNLNSSSRITDIGVGGFDYLNKSFEEWSMTRLETEDQERTNSIYSTSQIRYLNKIMELCKQNNVELILLSTPFHSTYPTSKVHLAENYYQREMKSFRWLDYSKLSLPDSCFADYEHLNSKGSTVFSKILMEKLN